MATTTVRIPEDLKTRAGNYAENLGISLNALVLVALKDYLDLREGPDFNPGGNPITMSDDEEEDFDYLPKPVRKKPAPGRNSLCPCGSGKKYKRCCGA